jgi:hypothetical protein
MLSSLHDRRLGGGADHQLSAPLLSGALDHPVLFFLSMRRLWFFRHPSSSLLQQDEFEKRPFIDPERLAAACERLLQFYPTLTGTLIKTEDGALGLGNFHQGALFRTQSLAIALDRVADATLNQRRAWKPSIPFVDSLAIVASRSDAAFHTPLLSIVHTRFSCGGVCLYMQLSHLAGDARLFFDVIRNLSRFYNSPDVARAVLDIAPTMGYNPIVAAGAANNIVSARNVPAAYRKITPSIARTADKGEADQNLKVVKGLLRFTECEQRNLQASCRANTNGLPITRVEALAAHLTVHIHQARSKYLHDTKTTVPATMTGTIQVDIIYDIRHLVDHSRREGLVGNFHMPVPTFIPSVLLDNDPHAIAKVAALLHTSRKIFFSGRQFSKNLEWLARQQRARQPVGNTCLNGTPGTCNISFSAVHRLEQHKHVEFDGVKPFYSSSADAGPAIDGLVACTDTAISGEVEVSMGVLDGVWECLLRSATLFPPLRANL